MNIQNTTAAAQARYAQMFFTSRSEMRSKSFGKQMDNGKESPTGKRWGRTVEIKARPKSKRTQKLVQVDRNGEVKQVVQVVTKRNTSAEKAAAEFAMQMMK